jgi:LysM repeat protein
VGETLRFFVFNVRTYSATGDAKSECLPAFAPDVRISGMKFFAACAVFLLPVAVGLAQPPQSSPSSDQMAALEKKIDQINTKIDALSQQILKLEQQVSRPGMMIGEATPGPVPNAATSTSETAHPAASNGSTHVVARGETLTSIAKQNKIGVEELQKFNHIEDGRKLQAGQTIMIPASSASPAASASPSPTAE